MASVDPLFEVDAPKFYDFANQDANSSAGDSWFDRRAQHLLVDEVNVEFSRIQDGSLAAGTIPDTYEERPDCEAQEEQEEAKTEAPLPETNAPTVATVDREKVEPPAPQEPAQKAPKPSRPNVAEAKAPHRICHKPPTPNQLKPRPALLHRRSVSHNDLSVMEFKRKPANSAALSRSPSVPSLAERRARTVSTTSNDSRPEHHSQPLQRHGSKQNLKIGPTSGTVRPTGRSVTKPRPFELATERRSIHRREQSRERERATPDAKKTAPRDHGRPASANKTLVMAGATHRRERSLDRAENKDSSRPKAQADGAAKNPLASMRQPLKVMQPNHPERVKQAEREKTNKQEPLRALPLKLTVPQEPHLRTDERRTVWEQRKQHPAPRVLPSPPRRSTQSKPFSFDVRDRELKDKHERWVKDEQQRRELERKGKAFRAHPVQCVEKPLLPPKKVIPATQPKAFNWHIDERLLNRAQKQNEEKENEYGTAEVVDVQLYE